MDSTAHSPSPPPSRGPSPTPTQIGPYRILEALGEGGMGTVYLAEQKEPVRRRVALKLIKLGMDSKAVLARFEAERKALSMMEHSCIATVLDAGVSAQGQPYFVMEFVKGIPITDYCDQNKLGLKERIELLQKVCSGVQHAHLKGVMHRDLKPGNVLVTLQDGKATPKIIDFGLAKAVDHHLVEATLFTEQGVMLGTPEYMSPEQAGLGGLDVDTRTDVYSLGVLLYELLVGELPFSRKELRDAGMLEMQRVIREQEPVKPSTRITSLGDAAVACAAARRVDAGELQKKLSGDLDWIVLKALEKDRTRRYETAQELAADLQRHLDFEPVLASPPSVGYRVKKFVRRYRVQCAAAAVVFLAILGGGIGTALGFAEARTNETKAREQEQIAKEQTKLANERATEIEGLLAKAKAEAETNLVFADAARLAVAKRIEEDLYPAFPEKAPAMEAWLRDFAEPLAARLPALVKALAELRAKAKPSTEEQRTAARANHPRARELERLRSELASEDDADRRKELQQQIPPVEGEVAAAGYEFVANADGYKHGVLSQLVLELTPFVTTTVPAVRTRLIEARTVRQKTIDTYRAQWDEAITAIRASDDVRASKLYGGQPLTPQVGLVPLRMDPDSKLWEFVHLASGTPGKEIPSIDPTTKRIVPDGDMGIVFVLIPGGTLPAGTPTVDNGEQKRLGVKLDAFFLGKYEMTQGQWLRLTGSNPSYSKSENNLALPVEKVSWFDCEAAMRHQGLELPSELRWEYACRAGTKTRWWTGDDETSIEASENVGDKADRLLAVGSKNANRFGLFDMGGNLWEWCADASSPYGTERPGDGLRPTSKDGSWGGRCLRGGDFDGDPERARSGIRLGRSPTHRSGSFGLRAARTSQL
jgi:serine/threonine protein kinase/formylglycine-generating enzyme required for sulfatase activity